MTPYKIQLAPEFQAISKAIQQSMRKFEKKMQEIAEMVESFSKRIGEIPDEITPTISKLAHRGWYPSNEMDLPFIYAIDKAFNAENGKEVDKLMAQFVSGRVDALHEQLASRFQSRSPAISSSIGAHLAGQYFLSVPLFLIQAEGICVETFGVKLSQLKIRGIPLYPRNLNNSGSMTLQPRYFFH